MEEMEDLIFKSVTFEAVELLRELTYTLWLRYVDWK